MTESHDEIADLKEKMKVLTHQFDQMKEEIVAKVIMGSFLPIKNDVMLAKHWSIKLYTGLSLVI